MTYTIEQLVGMGGAVWERKEYTRVYFNDLTELYGLDISTYNTGNISTAKLDGEEISNTEARKIALRLVNCKFWYDMADGRFNAKGLPQEDFDILTSAIREKLK